MHLPCGYRSIRLILIHVEHIPQALCSCIGIGIGDPRVIINEGLLLLLLVIGVCGDGSDTTAECCWFAHVDGPCQHQSASAIVRCLRLRVGRIGRHANKKL